jgi:flagellin
MAAILSTNMASLYAQKNLSTAQASLSDSVQRLSSGTRINSAKDDAAGYGIAESVRGTKNIVDQNIRNAKDGISWAQTAEGALDVVGKILQRALTLTTQKLDPTLNSTQTASINTELNALKAEVDNITLRTKFQGGSTTLSVFGSNALDADGNPVVKVSDAVAAAAVTFTSAGAQFKNFTTGNAVAAASADTDIRFGSIAVSTGSGTATTVTATMIDSTNLKSANATVAAVETLIASNATNRGSLGAAINSLEYAVDNMQTLSSNLADGISRIVDTDYAAETSNLTRTQILQQAATSMLAQANQMPNVILTLLK